MILTTTRPHDGYDFLRKYDKDLEKVSWPTVRQEANKIVLPDNVKLVVFTGGEDVSPFMYDRKRHKTTSNSVGRDIFEQAVWKAAKERNIPVLGICRGMQFINVMCGGELVQHTTGHAGRSHKVYCIDDSIKNFNLRFVTSLHHQMVIPPKEARVAAVSGRLSNMYLTSEKLSETQLHASGPEISISVDAEVEAVIYEGHNAVGVQFHPELSSPKWQADIAITEALIEEYLL